MTTLDSTSGAQPVLGARVLTVDGTELGRVKDVSSACFKVDVALRPDYWLATSYISTATPDTVQLTVTKDHLDTAKVDDPGHGGIHGHGSTTVV